MVEFLGTKRVSIWLTGIWSDLYFYKVFLDGALIWWTILYLKDDLTGAVVTQTRAQQKMSKADESIVQVDIGTLEYVYYAFLTLYGFGNLYFHHMINKDSTGFLSIGTLILSMADVAVAAIAIVNFWHLASGKLVRLQKQLQM